MGYLTELIGVGESPPLSLLPVNVIRLPSLEFVVPPNYQLT